MRFCIDKTIISIGMVFVFLMKNVKVYNVHSIPDHFTMVEKIFSILLGEFERKYQLKLIYSMFVSRYYAYI